MSIPVYLVAFSPSSEIRRFLSCISLQMAKGFRSAGLVWWLTIPTAIAFSFLLAHQSQLVPFQHFGVVGAFFQYLVNHFAVLLILAFWATVAAHIYEAILARGICQKLRMSSTSTLGWMLQTFILGYPSLKILRGYIQKKK